MQIEPDSTHLAFQLFDLLLRSWHSEDLESECLARQPSFLTVAPVKKNIKKNDFK